MEANLREGFLKEIKIVGKLGLIVGEEKSKLNKL